MTIQLNDGKILIVGGQIATDAACCCDSEFECPSLAYCEYYDEDTNSALAFPDIIFTVGGVTAGPSPACALSPGFDCDDVNGDYQIACGSDTPTTVHLGYCYESTPFGTRSHGYSYTTYFTFGDTGQVVARVTSSRAYALPSSLSQIYFTTKTFRYDYDTIACDSGSVRVKGLTLDSTTVTREHFSSGTGNAPTGASDATMGLHCWVEDATIDISWSA